jgi:hypothetical protein
MRRTTKWLMRAVLAAGIVGALAFGAQQAVADRNARDACDCPTVGSWTECDACCGNDGGFCTAGHRCLCS